VKLSEHGIAWITLGATVLLQTMTGVRLDGAVLGSVLLAVGVILFVTAEWRAVKRGEGK
jgi:uncharacterized membrane protein